MKTTKTYNGHPSYEHWNAALWFGNEEWLYRMARDAKSGPALWQDCQEVGYLRTKDGVALTKALVTHAWRCLRD